MPIAKFFTAAQLLEMHPPGEKKFAPPYKFARINGEYRFCESVYCGPYHADLVDSDETADAAGTIGLMPDYWRMMDTWSSSLKLSADEQCYKDFTKLFQREEKNPW